MSREHVAALREMRAAAQRASVPSPEPLRRGLVAACAAMARGEVKYPVGPFEPVMKEPVKKACGCGRCGR